MPEYELVKFRMECLKLAIGLAQLGQGEERFYVDTDEIVSAAERFAAFVLNTNRGPK